jgi:hypothetical protein
MSVGDIWQIRIFCRMDDQLSINIRHYQTVLTVGPGSVAAQDVADTLRPGFQTAYLNILTEQATFQALSAQKLRPLPVGSEAFSFATLPNDGLRLGDALPRQTCGVISLRTALAGRSNRGRLYAPFPAEVDNEADATPTPDYVTRLVVLASLLDDDQMVVSGAVTETLRPAVLHRSTMTVEFITSTIPRQVWGTQRRRGSFGRPNPPAIL